MIIMPFNLLLGSSGSRLWMQKIALLMSITCQPFFHKVDPGGIANRSVTHIDRSARKWHPKSYGMQDVTDELLENITVQLLITLFLSNPIAITTCRFVVNANECVT